MVGADPHRRHEGPAGNDERLAFLFDTRRVTPSGLACELVLPEAAAGQPPTRQFARTPYAVSFLTGSQTFVLVTLHVLYGSAPADRVGELTATAEWLADWARQEQDWGHNLLALGDFNIDRAGDPLYQAFTSTGLTPPAELNTIPRTIFDQPGRPHFYDQIALVSKATSWTCSDVRRWTSMDGPIPTHNPSVAGRSPTRRRCPTTRHALRGRLPSPLSPWPTARCAGLGNQEIDRDGV